MEPGSQPEPGTKIFLRHKNRGENEFRVSEEEIDKDSVRMQFQFDDR